MTIDSLSRQHDDLTSYFHFHDVPVHQISLENMERVDIADNFDTIEGIFVV